MQLAQEAATAKMARDISSKRKIVNRPLAGTVRRAKTGKEDQMLEKELLNDAKQCAEHIMLVDLGRNGVGKDHDVKDSDAETLAILVELFAGKAHQWSQAIYALSCVDVLRSFAVAANSSVGPMSRPVIVPHGPSSTISCPVNGGPTLQIKGSSGALLNGWVIQLVKKE